MYDKEDLLGAISDVQKAEKMKNILNHPIIKTCSSALL